MSSNGLVTQGSEAGIYRLPDLSEVGGDDAQRSLLIIGQRRYGLPEDGMKVAASGVASSTVVVAVAHSAALSAEPHDSI